MADNDPGKERISGWRLIELLWPFNEMFRARLPEIRALPYDPRFEPEADEAVLALREISDAPWARLSLGAWRVLLERHQQLIVVAMANEAAGNPVTVIPSGLAEDDQRVGLALLLLLRMKLPFPAADRSSLELPRAMRGRPPRRH